MMPSFYLALKQCVDSFFLVIEPTEQQFYGRWDQVFVLMMGGFSLSDCVGRSSLSLQLKNWRYSVLHSMFERENYVMMTFGQIEPYPFL